MERHGEKLELSSDIVVVSCGAINSAALLLRSANDQHPRGLANGSDVVGRHYMGHVNSVLMAIAKCPNPTVFQKTLSVNDFYFGSKDWAFPMGHISFVGKLDGDTLKAGAPAIAPHWTLELMGKHSLDFWLTSEDLPDPNNRVTVDRDGKIVLSYKPNNEEGHKRLMEKLKSMMKQQTKCGVHGHDCHEGLFSRNLYRRPAHPAGRRGASEWDHPLWHRPAHLGSGCELPRARGGQSLCGGRKLLRFQRCRESRAHDHGQRVASGGSFTQTPPR